MVAATLSPAVAESLLTARALLTAGKFVDAARAYERLLGDSQIVGQPQLEALNALAIISMHRGDLVRARHYLTQARDTAPDDLLTLNHLAQLAQAEGDRDQAIATYRRVLKMRPELYASRLSLAQLIDEQGDQAAALPHYFRAITDAQRAGRWLSEQSTPPNLRPQVQQALGLVYRGRQRIFGDILARLESRFGQSEMVRVSGSIELLMGDARYTPSDARQQPKIYTLPDLPVAPYLDKQLVPELQQLEEQTAQIRDELMQVMHSDRGREEVFRDPALAAANLRSDRGQASWKGYYFYRYGARNRINCDACPTTIAALDTLPLCHVRDHGPEVLFSVLDAGTHLLPHRGVTNARVVGHLPLIVPPDCALKVAEIEHHWREGKAVLFDDTFMHEAWNRSDRLRVVLIFDLWHPQITEPERVAVTEILETLGDFSAAAAI
ncbi:MAG: Aspartate beta-hydroxylase [Hydrocarboniphaga sp.]|uniref:aspartyl/asparaginyl beta-hydroxylase domain-containing protein n=1 Tax=Hydrocarboniphaga sp. TaxID=2033016 RepID=UPI00261DA251|nr:aspartyl/asparaginyl beta-hydroxylase domain-containing protein [Hydrocarboniphaga sp.]MDB5973188.1 Aspartate beta-hydroxylase [Hydrocarboniphaga sp.]